jgi:hypothetical protein
MSVYVIPSIDLRRTKLKLTISGAGSPISRKFTGIRLELREAGTDSTRDGDGGDGDGAGGGLSILW